MKRFTARVRWTILAATTAICFCSCIQPEGSNRADDLPKLKDIGPGSSVSTKPYPRSLRPAPRVRLWCISLPMAASLDKAWQMMATEGVAPALIEMWRANGVRLGTIEAVKGAAFMKALGPVSGVETRLIHGSPHYAPQSFSPPLRQRVGITLTETNGQVTPITLRPGRLQLLVKLDRRPDEGLNLSVVPHHHVPTRTLLPRSPLETALDGRIFEDLAATVDLHPDRLLLIGLYLPTPGPAIPVKSAAPEGESGSSEAAPNAAQNTQGEARDRTPSGGSQPGSTLPNGADQSQPAARPPAPGPPIDLPASLGRYLLTASRLGRPIQMILVIELDRRN